MKKIVSLTVSVAAVVFSTSVAFGDTLAGWTFQTSASTNNIIGTGFTPGPTQSGVLADIGLGTASASHASSSTVWTVPAGNGSTNSWSSTYWAVGDFYQFSVSAVGYQNVSLSFDQTSSSTGPRDFGLFYSVNGGSYSQFGANYIVLQNGAAPNSSWSSVAYQSAYSFSFDLSLVTALNNATTVSFRLVDMSTVSANGGTVASTGTDRVDNFFVNATPVPEPSTVALVLLGGFACLVALRRKH